METGMTNGDAMFALFCVNCVALVVACNSESRWVSGAALTFIGLNLAAIAIAAYAKLILG